MEFPQKTHECQKVSKEKLSPRNQAHFLCRPHTHTHTRIKPSNRHGMYSHMKVKTETQRMSKKMRTK